jgi:hypothetical protein
MKTFDDFVLHENLKFNDDDKIHIKYNNKKNIVYYNKHEIGTFGIRYKGDITLYDFVDYLLGLRKYDDIKNITFKKSIVFESGFNIEDKYKNKGYGRKIIHKIFKDNIDIDNILLYATYDQDSYDFWLKIGGNIVYNYEDDIYFININRRYLK